ncbi:hypothetical protein QBC35DRAFT_457596 [Podospora australis]|uniref:Protein kinase domain-containing protein n=1 Tax=Podospora australis TaxID=1536484 RepID=A0AAN6WHG7_9PEZI|nr:hypothetical protein QBC35DRAFT_457596 [Podospora australis]
MIRNRSLVINIDKSTASTANRSTAERNNIGGSLETFRTNFTGIWGKPGTKFEKAHDVYSLGIVLFELSQWKSIPRLSSVVSLSSGKRIPNSDIVKNEVLSFAGDKLPHAVGKTYTDVILSCLTFQDNLIEGQSELEIHKRSRMAIVEPLRILAEVKL